MLHPNRPVLISAADIGAPANAFGFPAENLEAAVEAKTSGSYSNGAVDAAVLMMREAAVVINFVNITDTAQPIRESEEKLYRKPTVILGFNDHAGGSESSYKLLLNGFFDEEDPASYVLHSPPLEDDAPSNLIFHRANFTFPSKEAHGIEDYLPNRLKTAGAAMALGRSHYDFFLIGGPEAQGQLVEAFTAAGFGFDPNPYDYYAEGVPPYRKLEQQAKERHDGIRQTAWPRDQFSAQIEQLLQAGL